MTVRQVVVQDDIYKMGRKKTYLIGSNLNREHLICINCGDPLPKRKWFYCSKKCEIRFYETHVKDWSWIRNEVFFRDNYTCQDCRRKLKVTGHDSEFFVTEIQCDHIIPISLGGSMFDMDNLQTLCPDCHKKKTAKDISKLGKIAVFVKLGVQKVLA